MPRPVIFGRVDEIDDVLFLLNQLAEQCQTAGLEEAWDILDLHDHIRGQRREQVRRVERNNWLWDQGIRPGSQLRFALKRRGVPPQIYVVTVHWMCRDSDKITIRYSKEDRPKASANSVNPFNLEILESR
jgi:hypothetical protein